MAYRIVADPRAWWPVKLVVAREDGSVGEATLELRFRRLKVEAAAQWLADVLVAQAAERQVGADLPRIYSELVARIADDWRHVLAENEEPLRWDVPAGWLTDLDAEGKRKPLDAPNLRALMNEGGMFLAIFRAFNACQAAEGEIKAGN